MTPPQLVINVEMELQGETLGKNAKGLVEPIQAVGNTGNVGLGFPQRRRR